MLASSVFEPEAGGGGDEREKEGKKREGRTMLTQFSQPGIPVCY